MRLQVKIIHFTHFLEIFNIYCKDTNNQVNYQLDSKLIPKPSKHSNDSIQYT